MLAGSSRIGQEYLGNMGRGMEWDICRREWNVWDAASCFLQQWTSIRPSQKSFSGAESLLSPPTPCALYFLLFPYSQLLFILFFIWYTLACAIFAQETKLSLKTQRLPWFQSFDHWVSNSYFCSTSDLWLNRIRVYIFRFIGNLNNVYLWP